MLCALLINVHQRWLYIPISEVVVLYKVSLVNDLTCVCSINCRLFRFVLVWRGFVRFRLVWKTINKKTLLIYFQRLHWINQAWQPNCCDQEVNKLNSNWRKKCCLMKTGMAAELLRPGGWNHKTYFFWSIMIIFEGSYYYVFHQTATFVCIHQFCAYTIFDQNF